MTLMTIVLARHNIDRRVGMRMFQAVIVFGVATVVFALSWWLWLSLLALAIMGAADTISVVIRLSLVQLANAGRDAWPRRCGEFPVHQRIEPARSESGVTAALLGAMPAAVLGGHCRGGRMKLFPTLRHVERLE